MKSRGYDKVSTGYRRHEFRDILTPAEQLIARDVLTDFGSQPSVHDVERLLVLLDLRNEKEDGVSLADQPGGQRRQLLDVPLVLHLIRVAPVVLVKHRHRVDADGKPATAGVSRRL